MYFMHLLMILAGTVSGFEFVRFSALIRQQQVSHFALDFDTLTRTFRRVKFRRNSDFSVDICIYRNEKESVVDRL